MSQSPQSVMLRQRSSDQNDTSLEPENDMLSVTVMVLQPDLLGSQIPRAKFHVLTKELHVPKVDMLQVSYQDSVWS